MKKSIFADPAFTPALVFITPIFFVFSRNRHMVEPFDMFLSSAAVLLLACVIFFTTSAAIRFWGMVSAHLPRWARPLAAAAFCLLLVETCCFFLQGQLHAAIPDPRWLRILITRILPCAGLFLLVYRFGFFYVNVFLIIFCGLSTVNLSVHLLHDDASPFIDRYFDAYKINNRPNIYMFFLESYHSLDVQRSVYGIDTNKFEAYLENNNFIDYGKIYSNSPSTLLSVADTFSFRSSRSYARGNSDASIGVRRMLGGSDENTLFSVLKSNGYTTVFLVGNTGYFGTVKYKHLDDSDGINILPQNKPYISSMTECAAMLNTRFREEPFLGAMKRLAGANAASGEKYKGSLANRVSQAVAIHKNPDAPFFLAFKGGARHSPSDGTYAWRQDADSDWVRSGKYQESVKKGNRELQSICDKIIEDDPGALIILLGDHGAHRFRGLDGGKMFLSLDDLITRVREKNIPFQEFCDDAHAVFLGIRLPHGRRENISYGLTMSHLNLFRHIFAWLNSDKSILAGRGPSDSYWEGVVTVKEGEIATAR